MTTTTHTTDRDTVVAAFHSHDDAKRAVRMLKEAGFEESELGVASQDKDGSFAEQTNSGAGKGAAVGAAAGLGAGALWGLGIAAGLLPAIGPVIAGGTLAAIAASAAGTAAAGGVIGALVGLGLSEEEATYYDEQFQAGRTIVTVQAKGERALKARRILDLANAYDYERRDTEYARNPAAKERMNCEGKLVARKEVLEIGTHVEQAGEARVHKEVSTRVEHVEVPLKREELVIERTDLAGKPAAGTIGESTEVDRIVLKEEIADVATRTVAKEEVKVGKRVLTDNQSVKKTLREEEIVVERARTAD